LTQFRGNLSAEVRVQTGEEFPIFQDRKDILWGEQWKKRIEESLDEVTFLVPIVTPSFFKSTACRKELQQFLLWERNVKRDDLILPVYYVECPLLTDQEQCVRDELAQAIAGCQYADWRDLRFEPFTSPDVCTRLADMAVHIRDALERVQRSGKTGVQKSDDRGVTHRTAQESSLLQKRDAETISRDAETTRRPSAKTEPPTRVVDPLYRGDHLTITEAIKAANPGDRIIVRSGLYEEGLIINKPLEIIGEGDLDAIVVQVTGKSAVRFQTTMGRIMNLTLRQMGGGEWFGVDIAQGRLELEGCDISSQSLACVAIHNGADPRLRRNRIHDGKQDGIHVNEDGQGTLEDNDIFGNAYAGVAIATGGNPTVRRNRIHDGKQDGIYVYEDGQGTLEDNDIFGNAYAGVAISEGGNPTVRRNRIHDSKEGYGIFVYEDGQGTLEENDIFGNTYSGVMIAKGGNPTLRQNRITKNGYVAVSVYEAGSGTIEDNDLRGNARGVWDISRDSKSNLKRARNKK
jgi:parallel beta-helix repeat protein